MRKHSVSIKCDDNRNLELIALLVANIGAYSHEEEILSALEDGEISLDDITIKKNVAEIIFEDYDYMDLPNVYDDPSDGEMFALFKASALICGTAVSFEAEFLFCDDWAGYNHGGTCKFNGKKIEYFDSVNLSPNEPIEHKYSAELNGNDFENEKKAAFYKYSGAPAPLEIPEEYYDFL